MNEKLPPNPIDPIRFTRELCQIESTTYHEGAVGDFLADTLASRGWDVEKTPVEQPAESADAGPRWNVYSGRAGETPDLVFSTHMDTVPPYIPFSEDADFLYGRGVCDAKGILAAQVAAAETLRAAGYKIGSMDTVPPYIPFSEDADFLYGRGVCDAKGILAAQVAAAETLRAAGYKIGL